MENYMMEKQISDGKLDDGKTNTKENKYPMGNYLMEKQIPDGKLSKYYQ